MLIIKPTTVLLTIISLICRSHIHVFVNLQRFSQAFGFEVSAWDPVKNLTVSVKVDSQALKDASGQLAVCVGLAIRR